MSAKIIGPRDPESELQALLSVIGVGGSAASRMLGQLEEADFTDERALEMFRTLVALDFENRDIDPVSFCLFAKEQRKDHIVGDAKQIGNELETKAIPPQNFPSLVVTLKDRAARRSRLLEIESESVRLLDVSKPFGLLGADILDSRIFRADVKPEDLDAVYTLDGKPVSTVGNLTSVTSQAKTGKSAVIGAMIAAAICDSPEGRDFLGFGSENIAELPVLHFDTEQSPADHWHGIMRSLKRAGLERPPSFLRSYYLTGLPAKAAFNVVKQAIHRAADNAAVLHSVLIDGVGDLVADVNDAAEVNAFVAELHALAIDHKCPIVAVLHFNPETSKARGHLGSQLERKAESNLRLDKEEDATVIWSNKQRRAEISRDFGPRFHWCKEAGMHTSIENRQCARIGARAEAAIPERDDVFFDRKAMRYSDLVEAIKVVSKCSDRTAKRRVTQWSQLGVIEKSVANLWVPTTKDQ